MTLRSIPDTIESLRLILQEVEQTMEAVYDSADLLELERILLDRIDELELELAQARTADQEWTELYSRAS